MTKIDIMYLKKGREEFTAASDRSIDQNTNGELVRIKWNFTEATSPVQAMNDFLDYADKYGGEPIFAKLDNDVIVPPGWVEAAIGVMDAHPELDILGLEPWQSRTPAPWSKDKPVEAPDKNWIGGAGYVPVSSVGGIFLARRSAFRRSRPKAEGKYGGFTSWQNLHPEIVKGWIVPPLKLFLLDRLPIEPWASLSKEYIAHGEQRYWTPYTMEQSALWSWWKP